MSETSEGPKGLPTLYDGAMATPHDAVPARRRVGGLGVVRHPDGRVLMTAKAAPMPGMARPWNLVGGAAERNECIAAALGRGAYTKLGLTLEVGRLLVVHHMYAEQHIGPAGEVIEADEGVNFVFDCGTLDRSPEDFEFGAGVTECRWVAEAELGALTEPFMAVRVRTALEVLGGGETRLLTGHPL